MAKEDEGRALLAAVLADPDDVELVRVYGDWLCEQGDPRGELIALHLRLANETLPAEERHKLEGREQRLQQKLRAAFNKGFGTKGAHWGLRYGLLRDLSMDAEPFLQHAEEILARDPVESLSLWKLPASLLPRLAACAALQRIRVLNLRRLPLKAEVASLLASPHLSALERLDLRACGLGARGGEALAKLELARVPRLRELVVPQNGLGDRVTALLAESPLAARLTLLDLSSNSFGDRGVIALASGLRAIVELDLAANYFGLEGCRALAENPHLAALERLRLTYCRIGGEGLALLAASPHLGALRRLEIDVNNIDDAGALALARSKTLGALQEVVVGATGDSPALMAAGVDIGALNQIGSVGMAALRERFGEGLEGFDYLARLSGMEAGQ